MGIYNYCKNCGKPLTNDEIGLHKKLVNRGATEFLCMECLCAYFDISVSSAKDMIEKFRLSGCSLFAKNK
jgi:hypothetical protein